MSRPSPAVVVLGGTGQIGHELVRALASISRVVAPSRTEVDLFRPDSVGAFIRAVRPGLVWNAAAATEVDPLEANPELASRVNAEGPMVLAEEIRQYGGVLCHFSTDYVFDGLKGAPYAEDDIPRPVNVYGRSKLEGENRIRASGCRHVIVRTSWVYSWRRRNFLRTIVSRGLRPGPLPVVDDQVGVPTFADHLADAAARMTYLLMNRPSTPETLGTFHLTGEGATSWYGFAQAVREGLLTRGIPWQAVLSRISSAEYNAPAKRPLDSRLACERVEGAYGVSLPDWRDSLASALDHPDRVAALRELSPP